MSLPSVQIFRHTLHTPWTYADLDRHQKEISDRVLDGGKGALLISEVSPVITLGRRSKESDLLLPPSSLQAQGVEIYPTHRGGLATYHGPGQWVIFAVDRLDRLVGDPKGVRLSVEKLLQVALEIAQELGHSSAEIRDGDVLGVWTSQGKLASVGVQIKKGVLLHGLCINGYATPQSFLGIRPCGLDCSIGYLFEKPEARRFDQLPELIESKVKSILWQGI